MNVYKKLNQARLTLQSMTLKKSGHNKFAGYQYFELGDFLPAINAIFADVGLCSHISFNAEIATLTVVSVDDGSKIDFTCPLESAQLKDCHPVQNLGASITYIRRYLYVNAMEIVEHDALDSTTGADKPKQAVTPMAGAQERVSESEMDVLKELAMEVIDLVSGGKAESANELIADQNLEADQKVALWSLLDSKVRSALKKAAQKETENA